jgi:hypothetical protein
VAVRVTWCGDDAVSPQRAMATLGSTVSHDEYRHMYMAYFHGPKMSSDLVMCSGHFLHRLPALFSIRVGTSVDS